MGILCNKVTQLNLRIAKNKSGANIVGEISLSGMYQDRINGEVQKASWFLHPNNKLSGGFKPKWSNLTNIFQMGWLNHQL